MRRKVLGKIIIGTLLIKKHLTQKKFLAKTQGRKGLLFEAINRYLKYNINLTL